MLPPMILVQIYYQLSSMVGLVVRWSGDRYELATLQAEMALVYYGIFNWFDA